MNSWTWFGYGLLIFLGLLWVRRFTRGKLRCNIFSAAIAATIFMGVAYGFSCLPVSQQSSENIKIAYFLFMGIGLIPATSAITLILGKALIPHFQIRGSDIFVCSVYLSAWTFVALLFVSFLKILGFLLMVALFGGGMPRAITRVPNDEYHHY